MLLDQYSRRERVHRVPRQHGDGCLKDDRPAVELRSHDVHGRASHTNTVFERLGAFNQSGATLVGSTGAERVQGGLVSWDMFDLLQAGATE